MLLAATAAVLAALMMPAISLGHETGSMDTVEEHMKEDSVTLTPPQERRMQSETDAVTTSDAAGAADAVPDDPAQVGQWGPLTSWPLVGINLALLTNGKVLAYDSSIPAGSDRNTPDGPNTYTRATIWDPANNDFTDVTANTGVNIFCSGLAHLMDGRIFTAGGNKNVGFIGITATHTFDSDTNTWTKTADMQYERWYPSVTPLPNGEMLITEGHEVSPSVPHVPEVREIDGTIRQLTGADEQHDLYPWMDVGPDGRAYLTGPGNQIRSLDTSGTGHWQAAATRDGEYRSYGSHALYGIGRVLVAGGGGDQSETDVSSKTARVINLNGGTPQVTATDPMEFGRRQFNLTVLADGSVLATGGNSSGASLVDLNAGVYNAELWNPETGHWKTLAAEQATRQYHSTALLLPDGRVLSAGGGVCGTCDEVGYINKNGQVFSPPYLFKTDGSGELATRPVISHAPRVVGYNAPMSIRAPDATSIDKVALIRLGAVTHSVNMEQRFVPLSFSTSGTRIASTSPLNANIAPPGPYMLFVIGSDGVPSMATMVRVDPTASQPPAAPLITGTTPVPPANDNSPKVTGTAAADSTVSIFSDADCTGTPLATGTAAEFASPGIAIAVGNNTTTSLRATATDSGDNISDCSTQFTYTEDSTAPGVPAFATDPPSPANDHNPEVKGTAENGSNVRVYSGADCNGPVLASGNAAAFSSTGFTITVDDDTNTDFRVTATDAAGNASTCSNALPYAEDSTPPAVPTFATNPPSPANDNRPEVMGTAENGSTVRVYSGANCNGSVIAAGPAAGFASPGFTIPIDNNTNTDFRVRATDAAGNVSTCSGALHYTEDSTAPGVPAFATDPPSPANDHNPEVKGTAESGSTVKVYSGADCTGAVLANGDAQAFASTGFTATVADDSSTDFRVTAADAAGNTSNCSSPLTYVEDSTPPAIPSIATTPPSPANDNNPEVRGTAESGSSVNVYSGADCNGAALATRSATAFASTGFTATVADDSSTDFQVTATDAAGNTSNCSSPLTYVEDSSGPGPPSLEDTDPDSPANDEEPEVKGTAAPGSTVKVFATGDCTGTPLGTGTSAALESPGIAVTVGGDQSTPLSAMATDSVGNNSSCSNPMTYVEDSTGPETTAAVAVAGPTATATFSSEVRATFECDLDGAGASGCQSPAAFTNLVPGDHTLTIRATDPAGNPDLSPAELTFTVEKDESDDPLDATAPETKINKKPKRVTTKRSAEFKFGSSEPQSRFRCRLDAHDEPCRYRLAVDVGPGRHHLSAAAIDPAGNADQSPAVYSWRVKRSSGRSRVGGELIAAARVAGLGL